MTAARRLALGAAALGCIALAVTLALWALDVSRWNDAFVSGDVRFRVAPEDERLWRPAELVPLDAARRLLAVQDDVDFREAVRALRQAELEDPVISDPEVAIRRNEAQARLEAIVVRDSDDSRRSRAAGLLGVLGLARFVYETQEREALLSATIANLTQAIALDPSNDEAKYNLELAYQRGRGLELTEASAGSNAAPGGQGSKGAGAGQPGSGY
ncbi:MAG: hypothetical protein H0U05_12910 [Actinobacteria bacterium]|nr:hypothetical protein [Actinomycetota bacterium]